MVHAAAAFPETEAGASAPAVAEPRPPPQGAIVRLSAGALTAAAACRASLPAR
jgi:hypothetical protein